MPYSYNFSQYFCHIKLFSILSFACLFNLCSFDFNCFSFQKMKLLSAFFASLTTCSILEPLNDITTNDKEALLRKQVWQPSFPIRVSRNKRDLIGFNRQTNNIFSHQRNHSGRTGMKQSHLCHLFFRRLRSIFIQ